jgi:hypothetical protein
MLYPNPKQDQKAHVIGNKPKVLPPPLSVPADEEVPTPHPPCRRTPAKIPCHPPVEQPSFLLPVYLGPPVTTYLFAVFFLTPLIGCLETLFHVVGGDCHVSRSRR